MTLKKAGNKIRYVTQLNTLKLLTFIRDYSAFILNAFLKIVNFSALTSSGFIVHGHIYVTLLSSQHNSFIVLFVMISFGGKLGVLFS